MFMHKSKKGFTIVELVIVIAVIAILTAVLIPTFSNLVKKANESVDVQLVRQMNTILKADEAENGKPADTNKVKEILAENGIADFVPALSTSAFAWDSEKNVIVLVDKETNLGVFPTEYKGQPANWEPLAGSVNVNMENLGETLDEAIANAEFGQTIVLTSDQTLTTTLMTKNVEIDLGGKTLTAPNGFDLAANVNVTISNGDLTSKRVDLNDGANLVLNGVDWTGTSSIAFYPSGAATQITINGGTIIANNIISTSYSDGGSKHSVINIYGATLGSDAAPCETAISVINSGDLYISDCEIYANDQGIVSRASNSIIEDTIIYYSRTEDFIDTMLTYHGSPDYGVYVPQKDGKNYPGISWGGGSGSMSAPIIIGDFYAQHYSVDANCTIKNVTVNKTNNSYPDVYLSQDNHDVLAWDAANSKYADAVVAGTEEIVKTTLTCDNSVSWMVNPGKNDSYADTCIGIYEKFADTKYGGYLSQTTAGALLLYVDNVFVNGVEQAAGSTSTTPVPAN